MQFSIMFWGDISVGGSTDKPYDYILEISKYADANGYAAILLPERHFNSWGGLHPNPSVLAAAVAPLTKRIKLRAGSVVLPLHNPVRVVEEWSIVDNLSAGRVELAIASGWRDDDFVLAPNKYRGRKADIWEDIVNLQKLWRGEAVSMTNGNGVASEIRTFPRPVQRELPIWITSASSLQTMTSAGDGGYGLLTHLLGQDYKAVTEKVAQYNAYRARAGRSGPGKISLMVHTYIGDTLPTVREIVKQPLTSYLANSADLLVPAEKRKGWNEVAASFKIQLAEMSFERYVGGASLVGTLDTCKSTVTSIAAAGVTEICCLIDFGLPPNEIFAGLSRLTQLKEWAETEVLHR